MSITDCHDQHRPVPVSRAIDEPHDRATTRWRCRDCGQRVDPISGGVTGRA